MTDSDINGQESTDLDDRAVRALTQYLTVVPEAPDLYTVTSESGSEYTVDVAEPRCTCEDHRNRRVRCKHIRRVEYETGREPLPAWIDADALPDDFGAHVDAEPVLTDGGVVATATATDPDARPDDCACHPAWREAAPPCWPCYRAGFETPNPDAEGGD